MLSLVRLGDGTQDHMRSADGHFNFMCHALAGSALIDIPLSGYRVHGDNYFAQREMLEGLHMSTTEYIAKSRVDRIASAEILLERADRFSWLLGRSYWRVFDQCAGAGAEGSRRIFRSQAARETISRHVPKLTQVFGEARVAREVAWRFGYRNGARVMGHGFQKKLPLKLRGQLLLQSLVGPVARSRSVRALLKKRR
jgi:hypothetical protein